MTSKDFRFGIDSSANGLDLNRILVQHPNSTFFMRLENDSKQLELNAGDILQVDRSLTPAINDLVVVTEINDADINVICWTAKKSQIQIWGIVVNVIRQVKK